MIQMRSVTVAEAYLELLSLRGIDFFFGNPGTDFASLVEAFAIRKRLGKKTPRPLTVPHEIPLMGMAYGYYLATGRPQVVMVHVGVGTANSLGMLMTARRGNIPIIFSAGRTPITEEGDQASRSAFIHWPQESYDQASMLREFVKWDYELRTPSQLESVVDRALSMSTSKPTGPVYLVLPREVLATKLNNIEFKETHRFDTPDILPDPERIVQAADYLLNAKFPLIITSSIGRSSEAVRYLMELAEHSAIGVISKEPEYMNFPIIHPFHLGFSPNRYLKEADVILVLDCDVPWVPNNVKPLSSSIIIQAGIDPLYGQYPLRGFESDLTLQGDSDLILKGLKEAMITHPSRRDVTIESRREKICSIHDEVMKRFEDNARKVSDNDPIIPAWMSFNIGEFLDDDSIVVNEYDNGMIPFAQRVPGGYFGVPHQGYLGWAPGAALGIKLAKPDKTVITTVGEGSYMFSVPSAYHHAASAHNLPILTVVYNNSTYNAVRWETRQLYPNGEAVTKKQFPVCDLYGDARYEKICEAFGGYGERVDSPDDIHSALERAFKVVSEEKRQALINITCQP